ncbi:MULTISPECIES: glycosyltransferase family 4 protein [unclassified Streptomyces]|uniref:glycosyltransferase family 4 protein n=1 Tax=unclassified Streptomyces TaxID=2593676 RepID=UPI0037F93CE1
MPKLIFMPETADRCQRRGQGCSGVLGRFCLHASGRDLPDLDGCPPPAAPVPAAAGAEGAKEACRWQRTFIRRSFVQQDRPAGNSLRRTAAMPAARRLSVVARVYGYPPDHNAGSEWMLHSMLRPLAERGHRVEVWLSHPGKSHEPYEIDGVHVVPFQAGIDFVSRARRADVLVSHYENVPLVAGIAQDRSIPVAVICHDNFAGSFHNAAGADLMVYNSQWIRRDGEIFYARYPAEFLPKRSIVVRPPVIAHEYRTRPGDCVTLVNLNSDKGGELFWRIAAWSPEWRFRGVKGAYGEQVMPPPRLSNCEVVDSVPGHRMREHVYAHARVILMPSLYESWGRVAVEAFASGIPVIAHPTPGLIEALGEAGIFAYRDDPTAWIDALRSLHDPEVWALASKRARARSEELSAVSDIDLWCRAVEALPPARTPRSPRRRTVADLAEAALAGARTLRDSTAAPPLARLPALRRMRKALEDRAGVLYAGAGLPRTGAEPDPVRAETDRPLAGAGAARLMDPDHCDKGLHKTGPAHNGAGHTTAAPRHPRTDPVVLQRKDAAS